MKRAIPKPPPRFLFRYRPPSEVSLGHFEDLLRNNRIWSSSPTAFLDLDDCRARIDFTGTEEEWLSYYRHMFGSLGVRDQALEQQAHEAIAKNVWNNDSKHAEVLQGIQNNLFNSGVICLTDSPTDTLMWRSDYAGRSEGICLCFAASLPPLSTALKVSYRSPLPIVKFSADGGEQIAAFILSKGPSYSWEREWRFVDYNKGAGYKSVSPAALRAVVVGSLASSETKESVVHLVRTWKPHVAVLNASADLPSNSVHVDGLTEALSRPSGALLLEYLAAIPSAAREPAIDTRIAAIAQQLDACRKPEYRVSARRLAQEASVLIGSLLTRPAHAPGTPSYEGIALLIFDSVKEADGAPGLRA